MNVKRTRLTLLLLVLLGAHGISQETLSTRIHREFLKAKDYLDMDSNNQRAYATGVVDGMYMAPFFGAQDDGKALVSLATCVEGMKGSQVAAIIEKYIRDHPENSHWDLNLQAYSPMRGACPIK
jgi:hypothetical protein